MSDEQEQREQTEMVSPAEWDEMYRDALIAYRSGLPLLLNGTRVERLAVEAGGAEPPYTDRRTLCLELNDGTTRTVMCQWREFMK